MNRPEKSFRTKLKMAEALKTLLGKKPLDRVRIHEITDLCELNRQTFYYHFPDVYALFFWTLQQTMKQIQENLDFSGPWRQQLLALLRKIEAERPLFLTALDLRFEQELRRFFSQLVLNAEDAPFSSSQVTVFFSLLLHWLRLEDRMSPEDALAFFEQLLPDAALRQEAAEPLS